MCSSENSTRVFARAAGRLILAARRSVARKLHKLGETTKVDIAIVQAGISAGLLHFFGDIRIFAPSPLSPANFRFALVPDCCPRKETPRDKLRDKRNLISTGARIVGRYEMKKRKRRCNYAYFGFEFFKWAQKKIILFIRASI